MKSGAATPILIVQAFLYAGGNLLPIVMKGIEPGQPLLAIPSSTLGDEGGGAWLGASGLRAALRALDGRGPGRPRAFLHNGHRRGP